MCLQLQYFLKSCAQRCLMCILFESCPPYWMGLNQSSEKKYSFPNWFESCSWRLLDDASWNWSQRGCCFTSLVIALVAISYLYFAWTTRICLQALAKDKPRDSSKKVWRKPETQNSHLQCKSWTSALQSTCFKRSKFYFEGRWYQFVLEFLGFHYYSE